MNISAKTDIGAFRDSNQDDYQAGLFENGDAWAVVCDGMGGVSGGQVASKICVERVSEAIKRGYRENMTLKTARNLLNSAICAANSAVFTEAQNNRELSGMGTTVVAVIVVNGMAVIAHVGDSRAYVFDNAIELVTKDHSLVQYLCDTGKITEDEAKVHPDRNIITRAVGILSFVDVDFDLIEVGKNKSILICTDGLSGSLEADEMLGIIKENAGSSAEKLVEKAIEAGSRDNITAVLLFADSQGE
ncbi:MAG: Stp1/IreP family PP2C-type Ser/Thr phosphatase [Ruminococcaceae bacterium]|nr:Stp1/IreP family PP2C-type Ser/Thr phosphatase [Oscillospiraceae bacterium]